MNIEPTKRVKKVRWGRVGAVRFGGVRCEERTNLRNLHCRRNFLVQRVVFRKRLHELLPDRNWLQSALHVLFLSVSHIKSIKR